MRIVVSMALALSIVMTSACGGSYTQGNDEPRVTDTFSTVNLATLTLPLDPYIRTAAHDARLSRATTILAADCMARFGFRVAVPELREPAVRGHEQRYGLTDPIQAQRLGYRPDLRLKPQPAEPHMSAAAYAVMHGEVSERGGHRVPVGGCLGEARESLSWVDMESTRLATVLIVEASKRAEQDNQTILAFQAWSTCMKAQGYDYADPWQANDDPRWRRTETATPTEIQVATADVRCKREHNVIGRWVSVETAYQRRAVERNGPALTELRRRLEAELRNVTDVLAKRR